MTVVPESDIAGMEYLHCVVKETVRLNPAVPLLIPHESAQACNMKSPDGDVYAIPAKTRLMINAWAIGRDPKVWEDPLTFKAERFMGISFDPVNDQEMRMLPFGAGRRGCPALAQLLHSFDWRIGRDPSELDMNEKFRSTIPREIHLFPFPLLRRPLPITLSELCRGTI